MKTIDLYITEKLYLNKDIKVTDKIDEINDNFIKKIKEWSLNELGLKFDSWDESISIGSSRKYLLLNLPKSKRDKYIRIMSHINNEFDISKKCSTNNQHVYIYPNYESNITEKLH